MHLSRKTLFSVILLASGICVHAQQSEKLPPSTRLEIPEHRKPGINVPSTEPDDEIENSQPVREFFSDPWYRSCFNVVFDKYPYHSGPYLTFDNSQSSNSPEELTYAEGDKVWRYAVDTSFFYTPSGAGNITRFEGFIFKCIGPILELDSIFPFTTAEPKPADYIGNLRLGVEVALLQNNFINIIFTGQWCHYFNLDIHDGWIFGFTLRSYPVSPLMIEYRINMETFTDYDTDFAMVESHLEIGSMLFKSPYEIFVAWDWQYKSLLNLNCHGFEVGARFHF